MKAVILAAGKGTRLGSMTTETPKCLVEIGGRPILDYQLAGLEAAGVDDIVVVAGYLADQVIAHAAGRYRVLINDQYDSSNSIYSLWVAREEAAGKDFVLLNGDVVADPELLVELVRCPSRCAALVDEQKACRDGEMNVVIEGEKITAFSKQVPAAAAGLHFIRLATPTTDDARLPAVLKNTSGFVYYVSITGITGAANAVATDVGPEVARIKAATDLPVAVGFGVREPAQAAAIAAHADGVVVGSAFVDLVGEHGAKAPAKLKELTASMVAAIKSA